MVDHLIPEAISPAAFTQAKIEMALDDEFRIDSFENWVPAHGSCNSSKGKRVFAASPAMIKAFDDAKRRAPRAIALNENARKDRKRATLLAQIESAKNKGVISLVDIGEIFMLTGSAPSSGSADAGVTLYAVAPGFSAVRTDFTYSIEPNVEPPKDSEDV